jgi:hypothetical protein
MSPGLEKASTRHLQGAGSHFPQVQPANFFLCNLRRIGRQIDYMQTIHNASSHSGVDPAPYKLRDSLSKWN